MSRFVVALTLFAVVYVVCTAAGEPECGENENWDICGAICEPSCKNPLPNRRFCPRIQCTRGLTGGCRCQKGYLRSNDSRSCVSPQDC